MSRLEQLVQAIETLQARRIERGHGRTGGISDGSGWRTPGLNDWGGTVGSGGVRGAVGSSGAGNRGWPAICGTGLPSIDLALGGGLGLGRTHEWLSPAEGVAWFPPLSLLTHLASQSIAETGDVHSAEDHRVVVWVGQRCWPYGRTLWPEPTVTSDGSGMKSVRLLWRSLLVDASDEAERLWAMEVALRSPAVAAVVGDATGLGMAESRRLQLAAEAGGGLGLLARPSREQAVLTACTTRWLVQPCVSPGEEPRWTVCLLRRKGVRPLPAWPAVPPAGGWIVELHRATGRLRESSELVDRPGQASPALDAWRRSA